VKEGEVHGYVAQSRKDEIHRMYVKYLWAV